MKKVFFDRNIIKMHLEFVTAILVFGQFGKATIICPGARCGCRNANGAVNCNSRRFTYLPFFYYPRAHSLSIKQNSIRILPTDSFDNLQNVQLIDLSNNQISTIEPFAFLPIGQQLNQLRSIILANNQIDNLNDHTFESLPELNLIDLRNNNIQRLKARAFRDLPKIKYIKFSGNPIKSCNSFDFYMPFHIRTSVSADGCHDKIECGRWQTTNDMGHPHKRNPVRPGLHRLARIVGGQSIDQGHWPWYVQVKVGGEFKCGGTIINEKWVVTAAHCATDDFFAEEITVHANAYDAFEEDEGEKSRKVIKVIRDPDWDIETDINDIALMKIAGKFRFAKRANNAMPICLPKPSAVLPRRCMLTGHGDYQPAELSVFVSSNELCKKSDPRIPTSAFCTTHPFAHVGGGDSGGPLMCKIGDNWYLFGVMTRHIRFGLDHVDVPARVALQITTFTDVRKFTDEYYKKAIV